MKEQKAVVPNVDLFALITNCNNELVKITNTIYFLQNQPNPEYHQLSQQLCKNSTYYMSDKLRSLYNNKLSELANKPYYQVYMLNKVFLDTLESFKQILPKEQINLPRESDGCTPVVFAIQLGSPQILKILLDNGGKIDNYAKQCAENLAIQNPINYNAIHAVITNFEMEQKHTMFNNQGYGNCNPYNYNPYSNDHEIELNILGKTIKTDNLGEC